MLNQVILVGRLTDDPKVNINSKGKQVSTITLAVGRSFKNSEGLYDTDFIRCILWEGIAHNTSEYCKKGDVVGVKGRLQVESFETQKGEKRTSTSVVAEKVTFLTHNNPKDEDESNSWVYNHHRIYHLGVC